MIKVRFLPGSLEAPDLTKKKVHRIIFASHVDLDNALRHETPFDTGFAASSWWAQSNGQPAANPNAPAKGNPGGGRGSADPAVLADSVGKTLTLVNDAAYIGRLNQGHSPQAPAGYIEGIANTYQDFIDTHTMEERGR